MSADQWFVRLRTGNTITVSLDDLDAAFQRGDIDENTLVFKHGMKEWLPLGEAAGLDDAEQPAPASVSPVTVPQPTASFVPMAEPDAYSVRPVAFDSYAAPVGSLDDLDEELMRPRGGKKKVVFALVAAAAVLALGVAGAFSMKGADPAAAAAQMPAPTQIAAAAQPPPPVTEQIPQTTSRLSDEQKKALMVADDKLKTEQAKKAQDRAERVVKTVQRTKRGKGKEPFVKGGSKYDPLNASL